MQQAFLARKYLHECSELEDRNDFPVICLTNFRNGADSLNPVVSLLHGFCIVRGNVYDTLAINLVNRYDSASFSLDLLDSLSALADNGSDEVFVYLEGLDPRNERPVIVTRLVYALHHLAHDVHPAFMSLLERFSKHFVRKSVNLDIHLGCRDSIYSSGNLEVHVSEVIFIAKDVGQDSIPVVRMLLVCNKTHCDAGNWLPDLNASIHEG